MNPPSTPESGHQPDPRAQAAAFTRQRALATGRLALPNLIVSSAGTLFLLYCLLTLVLITVVELGYLSSNVAFGFGIVFAMLQFTVGPWLMDWMLPLLYSLRWVSANELPEHLRLFVQSVCAKHKMKFPRFGIIDDGAPQAFTYGHHPNNARLVISRGVLELLEPAEAEAVVAHELGHARHWDMALMTIANLVPLVLYYVYVMTRNTRKGGGSGKSNAPSWAVSLGAYILYIVSEYIVLWFSRTREYHADRFSGVVTGNPNALASALVKIAYGLASQDDKTMKEEESKGKKNEEKKLKLAGIGALGVLNIFDRTTAVNLVMSGASRGVTPADAADRVDPERVKNAMQWDLWNPWAGFFELNSTHPLIAKRLQHLSDMAVVMGKVPFVVFDRAKPESYWDDFAVDLFVVLLPFLGLLFGVGTYFATGINLGEWPAYWIGIGVALMGVGMLIKTMARYRGESFPIQTVDRLMGYVKVSPVRPIPATLTGTIIGRGVPGLVYSEDFVLRDPSGIIFLDYRQPLWFWNFLFGLLRAKNYRNKNVRVSGWFRRSPVPYLEISRLEVLDQSERPRRCYSYVAALLWSVIVALIGIVLTAHWWGSGSARLLFY